jgi:hypothetical protein
LSRARGSFVEMQKEKKRKDKAFKKGLVSKRAWMT